MSDPNKDWLEAELQDLRDLEAPPTVLPNVMRKVRQRAGRRSWARLLESRAELLRSFVLGISLVILVLLAIVNPAQFFSRLPGASALLNLLPLLMEAAKEALFQVKVFHFSVLTLLAPAIILSYVFLVGIASAIQHLANARK
jgi:hypothetical protein